MIITKDKRDVDVLASNTERGFSIKASAKSFKILSDGLYKNKILAIIRELSCNAYDAHIAAKKADVPFTIHFPSILEPHFSVKDDGIGLSREDVMTLYTTYFESTKTESNDYVGALGLGSKSPFSYVDNFTVTSRYNGEMMTFSCFISELGLPSIVELNSKKTKESNGLEVMLPVKRDDIAVFAAEGAKFFTTWLSVKPKFVGALLADNDLKVEEQGTGWFRGANHQTTYLSQVLHAIQGNVAYPIDKNILAQKRTLTPWQEFFLSERGMFVTCSIGELDIAPSREELDYTDRTIASIIKRVDLSEIEYMQILDKQFAEFSNEPTITEFRLAVLRKMKSLQGKLNSVCATRYKELSYKGVKYALTSLVHTSNDSFHLEVAGRSPVNVSLMSFNRWRSSRKGTYKIEFNPLVTFNVITKHGIDRHKWFDDDNNHEEKTKFEALIERMSMKGTVATKISTNYKLELDYYGDGNAYGGSRFSHSFTANLVKPILLINDSKHKVRSMARKLAGFLKANPNRVVLYIVKPQNCDQAYNAHLTNVIQFYQPLELMYVSALPKYPEEEVPVVARKTESLKELRNEAHARTVANAASGVLGWLGINIGNDTTYRFSLKETSRLVAVDSSVDLAKDKAVYVFMKRDEYFEKLEPEIVAGKKTTTDIFSSRIHYDKLSLIKTEVMDADEKLVILKRGHLSKLKKNPKLLSIEQVIARYIQRVANSADAENIKRLAAFQHVLGSVKEADWWKRSHLSSMVSTEARLDGLLRELKIKKNTPSPFITAWRHVAKIRDDITPQQTLAFVNLMYFQSGIMGGFPKSGLKGIAEAIFGKDSLDKYLNASARDMDFKQFDRYEILAIANFTKQPYREIYQESQLCQILRYVSLIDNSIAP